MSTSDRQASDPKAKVRGLGAVRLRIYEFHFFDEADRRPLLDFFDGADDAMAVAAARKRLADHASCIGVEVHQAERLVARLERTATDAG